MAEMNLRFGRGSGFVDRFLLSMLLTASASIFSTSFACLSLSSSALPCLNRASSEKFSRNARRRRGREVQVSIMCSLISFSTSVNSHVFVS